MMEGIISVVVERGPVGQMTSKDEGGNKDVLEKTIRQRFMRRILQLMSVVRTRSVSQGHSSLRCHTLYFNLRKRTEFPFGPSYSIFFLFVL